MRKLLHANIRRLWINKAFWISVLFMIAIEALYCILLLRQNDVPMELLLFISFQCIGVIGAIFASLFLGVEYSDGTIRNKLIVGFQRWEIYMASFLTVILALTIIYVSGVLTGAVIGITTHVAAQHPTSQILISLFIGWLACISYSAIFTLVGISSSSKARTAILNIVIAFLLVFVGMICFSLSRDGFLPEAQRALCQFLFEFNPFGQTFLTMSYALNEPGKFIGYAISLISLLTISGLYTFRKKDLK